MRVNIETIDHHLQRYPTCGDWWLEPGDTWQIRVSKMGDWRYELLVGVHELVECSICYYMGISTADVDKFDIAYEHARGEDNDDEPGDDPRAPYRIQHCIATGVERILAACLGVVWSEYANAIESL